MTNLKLFGDDWWDEYRKEEGKRLERAAIILKYQIKRDLSAGVKQQAGRAGDGRITKKQVVERSGP